MFTRFVRLLLVVTAILIWFVAIVWLLARPSFDALHALLGGLAGLLPLLLAFALSDAKSAQEAQNRRRMLEKVKAIWVANYLQDELRRDALAHGAPLARSLLPKPGLVQHPLGRSAPAAPPPHGTPLVEVFDDCAGELLLLGQPGTGKTFALLELARDLIARAEEKPDEHLLPIVFKLSSWGAKRGPLEDWLLKEFKDFYGVNKKIAQPWLESQSLTLLLDGLDEVGGGHIGDCVQAIERFREKYGLIGIVVSARSNEYEGQAARLHLSGAVELQPLTLDQIDDCLIGGGPELEALRETLRLDADLRDMARTPLFLSLMTRAYRGGSADALKALSSHDVRREHLFGAYVRRMFGHYAQKAPEYRPRKRRERGKPFSPEQTRRWLAWLARKMREHTQTTFLIECLQPTWLGTSAQRRLYRIEVGLVVGVLVGLAVGLLFGLLVGLVVGLAVGLVYGLFGRLIGLFDRLFDKRVGLFDWLFDKRVGLFGGLFSGSRDEIETVSTLSWSWRRAARWLAVGLVFGLVFGLLGGLVFGLLGGLVFGLLGGLAVGLERKEMDVISHPRQGIRRLTRNALMVWLLYGLAVGLVYGLVDRLPSGLLVSLVDGLLSRLLGRLPSGLVGGLVLWLAFGGLAVIQHFTLRIILARSGDLPWRLVPFLEQGVELIFLRRVGGAYEFIHPYLQEYFAGLSPQR